MTVFDYILLAISFLSFSLMMLAEYCAYSKGGTVRSYGRLPSFFIIPLLIIAYRIWG